MNVSHVIGARPNFVKAAPVIHALSSIKNISQRIVHTGQHYTKALSDEFISALGIPEPDINLQVGSSPTPGQQLATLLLRIEDEFKNNKPDVVILYGDVNSTLAAAIIAARMEIKIAHVEAGLRSFDMKMPEEINRILTDRLTSFFFVTEDSAIKNLRKEGVAFENIHFVGNTMIDSLVNVVDNPVLESDFKDHVLMTCHRPSNVDSLCGLQKIVGICESLDDQIVFPLHPRTRNNLEKFSLLDRLEKHDNVTLLGPTGYFDFVSMMKNAKVVITDSGGVQEETTYLGVPCLTLRKNTERPSTITWGTNVLVDTSKEIVTHIKEINAGTYKTGDQPPLWDGAAAKRIARVIEKL